MEVIVCVKQVPETTELKIDKNTNTLIREGVPGIINPFDMYALEEGIRLKEKHGGAVRALSMGPPQVKDSLKEAVAMGVDEAVLLSDRAFAGADTLATSYALAQGIRRMGRFDLIICGKQAIDGDTAQVGPGLAEELGIPHVTYVRKIREISPDTMVVERMTEGAYEAVRLPLPALITVVKEINEPRLPSLRGIMRAKKTEIIVWGAQDVAADPARVGLNGSATQVIRIFTPELAPRGEMLPGTVPEQVSALVARLRGLHIV